MEGIRTVLVAALSAMLLGVVFSLMCLPVFLTFKVVFR